MPQLLALWQGTYKTQQTLGNAKAKHSDDFVLPKSLWTTMSREVELSNHTTPAQIAPSVGHLVTKTHWTAETHSCFLMFLGPILLRHRLPDRYYDHFISLSEIAKRLTLQEIEKNQLPSLRRDIVRWLQGFERCVMDMKPQSTMSADCSHSRSLYYRFDTKFMPFCTAPIHAMLHVVDCIEWQGPMCHYWCFPIERYGGWLKRWVGENNKDTVLALSNRIVREEQVSSIVCNYALLYRWPLLMPLS